MINIGEPFVAERHAGEVLYWFEEAKAICGIDPDQAAPDVSFPFWETVPPLDRMIGDLTQEVTDATSHLGRAENDGAGGPTDPSGSGTDYESRYADSDPMGDPSASTPAVDTDMGRPPQVPRRRRAKKGQ